MRRALLAVPLTATILALAAWGCRGGAGAAGGGPEGVGSSGAPASDAALLRYRLAAGQHLRYELNFRWNFDGADKARIDEKVRGVIDQRCLGELPRHAEAPADRPPFYMVNFLCRQVERLRRERTEKGRDLAPVTAAREVVPQITPEPNMFYDPESNRVCVAFDCRGKIGYQDATRFHRLAYDSLIYLLPVLPAGRVRRGDRWSVEVPVYAGAQYVRNEFPLKAEFRLSRLRVRDGRQLAEMSWELQGVFDTQRCAGRFQPAFHNRSRIVHEIKGSGEAVFDVGQGVLISKKGRAELTRTTYSLITRVRREGQPAEPSWEKSSIRDLVDFQCRLLGEDEPDPAPSYR